MKHSTLNLLTLILILCYAPISVAHHSFAATFKDDESSTVEGVVTDFRFRNPHVLIYLDVTNAGGSVTNWMAEGSAATGWRRSGWKDDSLKAGDMMRITGSATIDGSPMVSIDEMSLLNPNNRAVLAILSTNEDPQISLGQATEIVTEAENAPYFIPPYLPTGEPNFTGTTQQGRVADPRTGGTGIGPSVNDDPPPYNAAGLQALADWDVENDPQVFCDQPGVVRQAGYTPYGLKINQYSDHITIEYEEYGTRRAVFFDNELPKPGLRTHMGDSVARYEGNTLIIETVNLLPNASAHIGRPISEQSRITERYSRSENPDLGTVLKIDTTILDPKYLTEPWTITRYKIYSVDYQFIKNECEPPMRERPANVYQYTEFDLQFVN
jgi:hypothetical protein